jgi:hypothetical protein
MNSTRVWAKLTPEIHEYFFRKVLAGEHRAKHDLTTQFFTALYNECRRRNIPAAWNIENTQLIADIMSRLNFDNESDRSRRPPNQAAQHEGEPSRCPNDPGAANGTGAETSPATTETPG